MTLMSHEKRNNIEKKTYPVRSVEAEYCRAFAASEAAFKAAQEYLPGGNSRTSAYYAPFPLYLDQAEGNVVRELGGRELLDFSLNYGTTILGHKAPVLRQALAEAMKIGLSHCAPIVAEQELARMICHRLSSVDVIRFTSSGTEAATMAIKAAKAFTGRRVVLKVRGGYHGSSLSQEQEAGERCEKGSVDTLPDIVSLPHDDPERITNFLMDFGPLLAAVICEPVLGAGGLIPVGRDFLRLIRQQCDRQGCLFILDEVMMFRLGFHGAQGLYDISPDLTLLGKIIGGGLPVGAFGGRREIMELFNPQRPETLPHAGTFNGNPLTMLAGISCLKALDPEAFLYLKTLTSKLTEGANALFTFHKLPATMQQCESFFAVHCLPHAARSHDQWRQQDQQLFQCLFLGLLQEGVMLTPSGLGATALSMQPCHIDQALAALEAVIQKYLV